MTRKLTPKQQRFVDEYLIDLNATQAAIRAGYSKRSADKIGPQLLGKSGVAAALTAAKTERSQLTKIDANYVLMRLTEIDQMDVLDILDDEGNLKPLPNWPKIWRTTLSGLDLQRIREYENNKDEPTSIETVLQKIKWPDKVKNLELIGRHVDVQAWKDQRELSGNVGLGAVLDELDGKNNGLPAGG